MRLEIEKKLEAVLGLAEEAVGLFQDVVLLVGEAADLGESVEGEEGVALADLGQVAAVEELEELDGELDVADAAVPGLDLAPPAPPPWRGREG